MKTHTIVVLEMPESRKLGILGITTYGPLKKNNMVWLNKFNLLNHNNPSNGTGFAKQTAFPAGTFEGTAVSQHQTTFPSEQHTRDQEALLGDKINLPKSSNV